MVPMGTIVRLVYPIIGMFRGGELLPSFPMPANPATAMAGPPDAGSTRNSTESPEVEENVSTVPEIGVDHIVKDAK
jgi:hypothetical protein